MRRIALLCLAPVALAGGLAGCVEDEGALIILQNQIPDPGCVVPGSPTSNFRGRGTIDVNAESGYIFTPVVRNYAVTGENGTGAQRIVQIQGADVELEFQEGLFAEGEIDSSLSSFSSRFAGAIDPDGGTTSFVFPILPIELLDAMAPKLADDGSQVTAVRAKVTMFGTIGGSDIESDPYVYWIDVCDGCMKVDVGSCTALPAGFTPLTGGECNTLQDVPLECCTSSGGDQVCPAVAEDEQL